MTAELQGMDFGSRDRVRYVRTYYLSTTSASEAGRVSVGPGQEVSGIVITLARAATATVRGVVRASGQASAGPFTVVHAREAGGAGAETMEMAMVNSDGTFTVAGLLPGTYVLEAQSMMGGMTFASTEVVVEGSDVAGVTLMLTEGATARGRIRFDTDGPPPDLRPSEVFVVPTFLDHRM